MLGSGAAFLVSSIALPLNGQTRTSASLLKAPLTMTDTLRSLGVQNFVPFIGEVMRVQTSDGRGVQLRLIAADDLRELPGWRSAYKGDVYSLTFETPGKNKLGQDVYKFEHYSLGSFSLLLVPVGLTGRRFEALINRTQD